MRQTKLHVSKEWFKFFAYSPNLIKCLRCGDKLHDLNSVGLDTVCRKCYREETVVVRARLFPSRGQGTWNTYSESEIGYE